MPDDKKFRIYLAGGIQFAPDKGDKWRKDLQQWAKDEKLPVEFVSPLDTKHNKKNNDLLIYTNPLKWAENMDKIRDGDFELIDGCDAVVTLYDQYAGDGTNREIEHTRQRKTTNYFIHARPKKTDIPHWVLLHLIMGGEEGNVVWLHTLEEFKDLIELQFPPKDEK